MATMETYTDYLRRVGNDHAGSGAEFTAKDYRDSAEILDSFAAQIGTLTAQRDALAAVLAGIVQTCETGTATDAVIVSRVYDAARAALARVQS